MTEVDRRQIEQATMRIEEHEFFLRSESEGTEARAVKNLTTVHLFTHAVKDSLVREPEAQGWGQAIRELLREPRLPVAEEPALSPPIIHYVTDTKVSVDFERMVPGKPYAYLMRGDYMLTVKNFDDELITLRLPKRYKLVPKQPPPQRVYE